MVGITKESFSPLYLDDVSCKILSKKESFFLDQNSKKSENNPYFPSEKEPAPPTSYNVPPQDYTYTVPEESDPYPTVSDPMFSIPMMPLGLFINPFNYYVNPNVNLRAQPTTVSEVEPCFAKIESDYSVHYPEFDKLSEEQRARIMASALEALSSLKTQEAGFNFPGQKIKPPDYFEVGEQKQELGCSFGHGIVTSLEGSVKYAKIVSEMINGHQVRGCHWQYVSGISKHIPTAKGKSNPNTDGIVKLFNEHFDQNGNNVPYIHICHSEGANTANQALKEMPEERRKNIHIISVGPAKYIDPKLCGSVFNIASSQDPVAKYVDRKGYLKAVKDRNILEVEEDSSISPLKSHYFTNPKTLEVLERKLNELHNMLNAN